MKVKDEKPNLAKSTHGIRSVSDHSEKALNQSEGRYQSTIESLTDFVCRCLPDGTMTFVNEAYCRLYGTPCTELIGQKIDSLIYIEDVEKVKTLLASLSPDNPQGNLEYRIIDSAGEIHWLLSEIRSFYDEVKGFSEIFSVGREITHQKQVEEELRKSQAELRTLYSAMNDVVIVFDYDGRYLRVAPTNASFLFKPTDAMIGKTLHEVLPTKPANLLLKHIHQSLDAQEIVSVDYELNINGNETWFSASISPLIEGTVIMVVHDITNRKKMEVVVERQARELAALYATSLEINTHINLPILLNAIIERATRLLEAQVGVLYLLQPDGKSLKLEASYNLPAEYLGSTLQIGEGISGRVAQSGKPLMVENFRQWSGRVEPFTKGSFMRVLGVPLKIKNQVIGVIDVTNHKKVRPFHDEEISLLSLFADQVAIAVENIRLFDEVQRLSITDELTGLNNRRHFFELAGNEFERARRYKHPLTALMIDIDHFKPINDTYGHALGDAILKDIGARFRANLRKIDLIGRYGGDEFSMLLPETDLTNTLIVAERLRKCIAEYPVDTIRGPQFVSVSIGIAALSQDCQNLKILLDRADQAMYIAKGNGTNRVEMWSS